MKKYRLIATILSLIMLFVSCQKIDATVESDDATSNSQEDENKEIDTLIENLTGEYATDEPNVIIEGDLITIKVPKKYQYEGESGELTTDKIQSGFIESKMNNDGSISYTIKQDLYATYIRNFKDGVIFRFQTIQRSSTYKTINKFDFNSELTKAVFWVNKDTYYGSGEEIAAENVGREMAYYQIFSGISEKDVDVEIRILDYTNEKEIEKIIY